MNRDEFREFLNEQWAALNCESDENKQSHHVVLSLQRIYASLSDTDKKLADQVFIDWACSGNSLRRFDALALIDHFEIETALPALRRLSAAAEESTGPSAPYDWGKLNRIIGRLSQTNRRSDPAGR